MSKELFKLIADVSTIDPKKLESVLIDIIGADGIIRTEKGFKISKTFEGQSARELNRGLLSNLRRVVKSTTMRSEWTHGILTERFFDYVPKGIREA
ncbi:MAG TPA: hypothetical protein VIS48_00855 [Candidatus Kryptonia bacterium]